jgi:hypothetical protein
MLSQRRFPSLGLSTTPDGDDLALYLLSSLADLERPASCYTSTALSSPLQIQLPHDDFAARLKFR